MSKILFMLVSYTRTRRLFEVSEKELMVSQSDNLCDCRNVSKDLERGLRISQKYVLLYINERVTYGLAMLNCHRRYEKKKILDITQTKHFR